MKLPDATQQALHYLIQTAAAENVIVVGFAFKANPPAVTTFGNCPDHADIRLYEMLCKMVEDGQQEGRVIHETVHKPA